MPARGDSMIQCKNYLNGAYKMLQLYDEELKQTWLIDGADCEVLMVGSAWKKGKIRIKIAIEFCEDSEGNTDELSILRSQI
jgi:hypothetical protein